MTKNNDNLNDKLKDLEKNFGLKRTTKSKEIETIKTGLFAFDYCLGQGIQLVEGGHKIELSGKESSGKTTFALRTVARFQELGKICVWVVSERFDDEWAIKNGIDISKLLKYYPNSVEDATEKILELVHDVDLIVIDSVASLVPEAELEKTMFEQTRGQGAKAYAQFTRKLYQKIAHETTAIMWINQIREKMGVMYGNPETTPCGRALKHMADTRIEFRPGKPIDKGVGDKKERIGIEINLKGVKNKMGTAQRRATIDFYFKDGKIDNYKNLLYAGIKYNVIEFSGKTYQFGKIKAVGKDNFIKMLTEENWKVIEKEVWLRLK